MEPYFSILIPVFNQEGKMDACFASLKNQTFRDFEVIFVDDGSKDNSYNELVKFADDDKRIKIVRHDENKSLFAARITGMKHATGKYVLFLDSDDRLSSDACESIYEFLQENRVDIVCFGFQIVSDVICKDIMPPETKDLIKSYMVGEIFPAIWKNCYSISVIKSLLEKAEPFYCNMGEDTCFAGMLYSCASSHANLNKILYYYDYIGGMSHTGSEINKAKIMRDLDSLKASSNHLRDFLSKYNPGYLEPAQKAIDTMFRFVLRQHVYYADDISRAVEVLNLFDTEELARYYDYGCNVMLVHKLKKEHGLTDEDLNLYL